MPLAAAVLRLLRADHNGSLVAPQYLKDAFRAFAEGTADAHLLRDAQDRAIRNAIARQEETGTPIVSDGELRRRKFTD